MPAVDIAPNAVATVTMTGAELNKIVADATSRALKVAGFGGQKAKPSPPRIGYTMKEAVSVTGLGRTTLYGAIRRRELRAVKKGARTIILDRDLRRWMEGLPPSNV
jgi:excisionase family DNA binding protein